MSQKGEVKSSILNYVENFIDKRDNELRSTTGYDNQDRASSRVSRDSIVINTGTSESQGAQLDNRTSASTELDADDFNLDSDPLVETEEGGAQVYKQQVFLRQYQPPTPDPVDIQVQEVVIKPQVQRPPIHVYVGPNRNRDDQRTPSPILIKSAPPPPPPQTESIVYNKYIPIDNEPTPQQIIIHRYPELPPKPRPIVVEQWLPNKPPPKRITYHHIDREEIQRDQFRRQHNRFIEYKKPHTTIEVEIVRLPVIKLSPGDYQRQSNELTRVDQIRSITQDPETLHWRI